MCADEELNILLFSFFFGNRVFLFRNIWFCLSFDQHRLVSALLFIKKIPASFCSCIVIHSFFNWQLVLFLSICVWHSFYFCKQFNVPFSWMAIEHANRTLFGEQFEFVDMNSIRWNRSILKTIFDFASFLFKWILVKIQSFQLEHYRVFQFKMVISKTILLAVFYLYFDSDIKLLLYSFTSHSSIPVTGLINCTILFVFCREMKTFHLKNTQFMYVRIFCSRNPKLQLRQTI